MEKFQREGKNAKQEYQQRLRKELQFAEIEENFEAQNKVRTKKCNFFNSSCV